MWFASLIFLYLSFVINLKLMKKIKILSLFVCLIALLAACEDEDITPSYGARTVLDYIDVEKMNQGKKTRNMALVKLKSKLQEYLELIEVPIYKI